MKYVHFSHFRTIRSFGVLFNYSLFRTLGCIEGGSKDPAPFTPCRRTLKKIVGHMQSALSAFDFYLSRNLRNYTMTNSLPFQTHENWARGNRKTLKWLKMLTKINFRTLKLKSHEEYLIYRTYFVKQKT